MTDEARRQKTAVQCAALDWDETGDTPFAPRSVFFDDIYFAGDGLAEATHVFLDGNNVRARFEDTAQFTIGELGFGTGLNFLAALKTWRAVSKRKDAHFHFISFEKHPLSQESLERAHRAWPELAIDAARLRFALPPPVSGFHRLRITDDVTLTLYYGDVHDGLCMTEAHVNAWFLDGFSPAKNPEMWTADLFIEIARLSAPGATAATFTVAGEVRRALAAAGFDIEKRPGFGRKCEMLAARLAAPVSHTQRAPWTPASTAPNASSGTVAVIGGGVAGASLAHTLQRYSFSPTVFETHTPASGASGNPAGLIMPRLDLGETPAAYFFRQAYLHTLALLHSLAPEGATRLFNQCGVLLKGEDENARRKLSKIIDAALLPEEWIEQRGEALFFPQAGVVDPKLLVHTLLNGSQLIAETVSAIKKASATFTIQTSRGDHNGFDAVIIANSIAARRFVQARTLPLSGVAGQLDYFPQATPPDYASAAGPYTAPAPAGGIIAGATYEKIPDDQTPPPTHDATIKNIDAARRLSPDIAAALTAESSVPRVSVRCQTPDRLPVAGPLPDWAFFSGAYDHLRFGKQLDHPTGELQDGVYILTGLGSRGLVTAPLCAEMIVSELIGAPNPVGLNIAQALHPARFFIRDLKRARPVTAEPLA